MNGNNATYAELEIGLSRAAGGGYQVELRFTDPESDAEKPPARGAAALDPQDLRQHELDAEGYGKALAAALFGQDEIRDHFREVKAAVEASGQFLRLRLRVDASAAELQALRWELLRDPDTGDPDTGDALATSEKMPFSRFMDSGDWRKVKPQPKSDLKALVAVAAPTDVADFGLAPVKTAGEVERARQALADIRLEVAGENEPLTLDHLVARLREGVDVLYLACHGAISRRGVPTLYLQKVDGTTDTVKGGDLATRVRELRNPPRLVFLASCESAGKESGTDAEGEATAQASIAPLLAEAGVSAIVAMQGKISMTTIELAVPVFFTELMKDGRIDRALAAARGRVRDRHDAWMPALYSRLKSGRLWYVPGFAGVEDEFGKWDDICNSVRKGTFVPILGADVAEHLYGTTRELAERLATEHGYPLARHQRTDLAKVAQFLSVKKSPVFARDQVKEHLGGMLLERHPDLEAEPRPDAAALERCLADANDPFHILTDPELCPASVYVTAASDLTLFDALREAGRRPTPLFSKWRKTGASHPGPPEYQGTPTPDEPLVFHAFGVRGQIESLVLTEDDYLEYLISTGKYTLLPRAVTGTLTESTLLFLGFSLDDLAFRVLFRMIMSIDGVAALQLRSHVGVQVDPEEHSPADVERARGYLKDYLGARRGAPKVDVYWGTAADFLRELRQKLEQKRTEEPVVAAVEEKDEWAHLR